MATHRRYSRATKAEVVADAILTNVEAAAEKHGIPRTTIDYWMDRPEFVDLRLKTREEVSDMFWTAIVVGVGEVAKGLTGEAPLRDKATAVGILYDKHALLNGLATNRTESRDLTGTLSDAEIADAIREAQRLATPGRAPAAAEGTAEG